jgi:hypothetical protein
MNLQQAYYAQKFMNVFFKIIKILRELRPIGAKQLPPPTTLNWKGHNGSKQWRLSLRRRQAIQANPTAGSRSPWM